jgi:hypothetical protein
VNDNEGIVIQSQKSGEMALPPQITSLQPAEPGQYTESESGTLVNDPDYLSIWDVVIHDKDKGGGTSTQPHLILWI